MTPFGVYLETLRRSRKLQQKQLAAMLDINPCYVSALERGRKGPPAKTIIRKLINSLELDQQEQELLQKYINQSRLTLKLPKDMSLEEFELVDELRQHLGSLSKEHVQVLIGSLRLNGLEKSKEDFKRRKYM